MTPNTTDEAFTGYGSRITCAVRLAAGSGARPDCLIMGYQGAREDVYQAKVLKTKPEPGCLRGGRRREPTSTRAIPP
eukprot:12881735-Alexandrium_andersonii.AAC.1